MDVLFEWVQENVAPGFIEGLGNELGPAGGAACLSMIKGWLRGSDAARREYAEAAVPGPQSPLGHMIPFRPLRLGALSSRRDLGSQLRMAALQVPDAWVPEATVGLCGVDLTGIWRTPGEPYGETYLRQCGPYFDLLKSAGQNPPLYAEGLINPATGFLFFTGQHVPGPGASFQGELNPDWTIEGTLTRMTPWHVPISIETDLIKVG